MTFKLTSWIRVDYVTAESLASAVTDNMQMFLFVQGVKLQFRKVAAQTHEESSKGKRKSEGRVIVAPVCFYTFFRLCNTMSSLEIGHGNMHQQYI